MVEENNNPLDSLSLDDMKRLLAAMECNFCMVYKYGVQVYGESKEENLRFIQLHKQIYLYYSNMVRDVVMKTDQEYFDYIQNIMAEAIKMKLENNNGLKEH